MVKIVVEDRHLAVYVDPRNRGEWEECVMIEDMPLPEGWAREAHVGLTASTGQLVDNHDIISLVTYAGKCLSTLLPFLHLCALLPSLHYFHLCTSPRFSPLPSLHISSLITAPSLHFSHSTLLTHQHLPKLHSPLLPHIQPNQTDHAVMEREEAKKYSQPLFELAPKNMYDHGIPLCPLSEPASIRILGLGN